ncbi:SDR family oxidoreductase [Pontibacter cellulosilyticus]|uniref:Aldehyde reductase n=1 Tax=Pontibacter cellulosilyticus TaxID=1720253 RepID=A0A923SI91_9BACT|nr:aldehyde reductase [Pontibacter cellulosilyticus]MBC5992498.1 aldehyde reductase [Pontibacter cellulosilyticus]
MDKVVLVTGGTGYIGSWVVKMLLEQGYIVRLTVRDKSKQTGYSHLAAAAEQSNGKLEIWEADLLKKGSFNEAAKGADAIIHMASPFTLRFKDAQKELIDPAVKGTQNVLEAANQSGSVKKVVLTSSVAAVHGDNIDMKEQGLQEFTEEHFNTSSSLTHQPYSYSKVMAEKEAWKMHDAQSAWKLVVINPSFVLGPSLSNASNSESLSFMKDILTGKYYLGAPELQLGFVDVRDVAKAHLLALENNQTEGRHILAERTTGVYEITQLVKEKFGNKYKLPLMKSPKMMLYLVGWMFGLTSSFITRNVGHSLKLNATKSKQQLGLHYTPLQKTVEDMVLQMQQDKVVA